VSRAIILGEDTPDRLFGDRREAGQVLAGLLQAYCDRPDVVVLGLARGGVPATERQSHYFHVRPRISSTR
jgi:predicted phosphoribosyltransferase